MKLLFITNVYPPASWGGYEESCLDAAEEFERRGHEVSVLTSLAPAIARSPGDHRVYRLLRASRGLKNRTSPRMELHNFRVVRRTIEEVGPDLVVIWNGGGLGRMFITAAERGATVVYDLHDMWLEPTVSPVRRRGPSTAATKRHQRLYRAALRLAYGLLPAVSTERLIFVSASLAEQYAAAGATIRHSTVVHNGVRSEFFDYGGPDSWARKGHQHRILYAGRIVPEKGLDTLVVAIDKLRRVDGLADVRLSIIGRPGSKGYLRRLRRRIRVLNLADAIVFMNQVSRTELADVYKQHDVLAFPSEWQEPFGLVLVEAMAVGLPVVTTMQGGAREIVQDGRNAITFRPGDADDLASKLAWVLLHPVEASQIARIAQYDARNNFDIAHRVAALESHFSTWLPLSWAASQSERSGIVSSQPTPSCKVSLDANRDRRGG